MKTRTLPKPMASRLPIVRPGVVMMRGMSRKTGMSEPGAVAERFPLGNLVDYSTHLPLMTRRLTQKSLI
jgi:hypothetical protein